MNQRKTKIVCTIGPSSAEKSRFKQMCLNGLDIARLNFSHGSQEEKLEKIKMIRQVSDEIKKPIAILADMSGPKLRLGKFEGILELQKNQDLTLVLNPQNEKEIPIQFDLSPYVKKNQRIFLNDGLVELRVQSIHGKSIHTKVQNNGWISSNKGVNVPDTMIPGASLTPKDVDDLEFSLDQNVDYIALSFVQTALDLKKCREMIKKAKSKAKIVVKIEKAKACEHLEEIIKEADAAMVARGDLGIEIPPQEVPLIQQKIIKITRQYNKPVIVATQMLESMVENPRPTRAEVSDIASAVLDQVDAVMLSAESASGKYPIEAVSIMRETILSVEQDSKYQHYIKINWEQMPVENIPTSALTSSAASLAYRLGAKLIIVATASGKTAQLLSSFRPSALILAITHDQQTRNQLSLVWGVKSYVVKDSYKPELFWHKCIEEARKSTFVQKGDKIVIITGSQTGIPGTTDSIKVATI